MLVESQEKRRDAASLRAPPGFQKPPGVFDHRLCNRHIGDYHPRHARFLEQDGQLLVEDLNVLLIAWGRYMAYLIVVLPIALWVHGRLALVPPRLGLQLVRSLLLVISTLIYIEALVTVRAPISV